MATFRTCWDPPYQSNHQRLGQPRRSRGVWTYDQPQPPQPRGMPSRLQRPKQVRRQRFRELRPLDPGLPYGMRDPELPLSKESRPGHHSNGVVMPPLRGSTPQDPNLAKLEYLWTALDKLESWMEANDRRLERLERLRPPARQPSGWDSPAHCAARRYSAYDQPRRSTCWDRPLYEQPPYTDMDSSYAPPRQYTALNFGQQPYSSDKSPRKPSAGYHSGQQDYQPTPPPYRPPRSPTCWESSAYVPPIPLGYPPPHDAASRRLSRPSLCHDPSSTLLPTVAVIPPPPPPSCSPDVSGEEGELLHDGPLPLAPILQLYIPDISEEETLLEEKEDVDPIEEVKKVVVSLDAARVTSQDDVKNGLDENGGATLRKFSKDSLGVVFDDKSGDLLDPTQWELEIKDGVRNGSVFARIQRPCTFTFDPGGDKSPKLLLSTLRCFVVSTLRTRWISTVGELIRSYLL